MKNSTIINGIDYGPLACLIGIWTGNKGMDVAPEPKGEEYNPYYETILYEAIGDVTNAEKQVLAVLRYHQVVSRISDKKVFHNETGYWSWDKSTDVIMQSLTIPRGVALLAGGKAEIEQEKTKFEVKAEAGDNDWGIVQSPFMRDKAKTKKFYHTISVNGSKMNYSETVTLDIYGKIFEHTDKNDLVKE